MQSGISSVVSDAASPVRVEVFALSIADQFAELGLSSVDCCRSFDTRRLLCWALYTRCRCRILRYPVAGGAWGCLFHIPADTALLTHFVDNGLADTR